MAATHKRAPRRQARNVEPNLRHVWLASLGLLVAARRESGIAAGRASARAGAAIADARAVVKRAGTDVRDGIRSVRGQVEPTMVKFSSDVEARLAPVLDKLGLRSKTARATRKTRKPAANTPTLRRATRKPTRRVAKKVAR